MPQIFWIVHLCGDGAVGGCSVGCAGGDLVYESVPVQKMDEESTHKGGSDDEGYDERTREGNAGERHRTKDQCNDLNDHLHMLLYHMIYVWIDE